MFLKKHIVLALLVFAFLVPKVYYLISAYKTDMYTTENAFNSGDAGHYLKIGKNLSEHGVYSDNNSKTPTESATWRPPIWPAILGFLYLITSHVTGLILLKSLLELILILSSIFIIKKYFKLNKHQIIPFFLLLIEPQYLKYSITFLSESITATLMLLFSICFILFVTNKKYSITIIVFGLLTVLCHPVNVFFVGSLLLIYGIINLKRSLLRVIFHGTLFIGIFVLWPIRNLETFNKGLFLTASQGAVFSKGWNKEVVQNFNNVDGDLADEGLNLKAYKSNNVELKKLSLLDKGKLYRESTIKFIKSRTIKERLEIIAIKLKSNFNPFPMKEKDTFIDRLAIPFRIFYVLLFIQVLYLLIVKGKRQLKLEVYYSCLVVLAILIGQIMMSVYTYTGLRFNSIYGLSLLFICVLINFDFWNEKLNVLLLKIKEAK